MPVTTTTTYTCENPTCPGPSVVTLPAANALLPDGWYIVTFQQIPHYFHCAACAAAWLSLQPAPQQQQPPA